MDEATNESDVCVAASDKDAAPAGAPTSEALVQGLVDALDEISALSEFKNAYRRQFCNLSRRIKLLGPLIEELKESKDPIPDKALLGVAELKEALDLAKDLLSLGSEGSKIFLVLETDKINKRFYEVTSQLEVSLSNIPFNILDISDEIKEQVELVHAQLKRAKEKPDTIDLELYTNLLSIYNNPNSNPDPRTLKMLSEKLQLISIQDLKQESVKLHEMVINSEGDPGQIIENMNNLLKKIKDFVQSDDFEDENKNKNKMDFLNEGNILKGVIIPDDFRCPISLEMMKDPVIVSTGQTYERGCIEKWIQSGHATCPKTQQKLLNLFLTPNFVLRSLISQWCESNGLDPPKPPPQHVKPECTAVEHSLVLSLLQSLSSQNTETQRSAACELRLLAKKNADNRSCIADAGAIPVLISLLTISDLKTQEHAVTCLLNLSIFEENKNKIIASGSVPGIVHVLKRGNSEARENAAATLFSLSVIDENKVTIGASGAIPPLVNLLSTGTLRGKKDAATALFNLCIYQGNKGKAVRAGIIPILINLLIEENSNMVDEALAILAILSSHNEGKSAIGAANAVPILIQQVKDGSGRNRENAAAVLVHLCNGDLQSGFVLEVMGIVGVLEELRSSGSDRGKRKAVLLLERINRFVEEQKELVGGARVSVSNNEM